VVMLLFRLKSSELTDNADSKSVKPSPTLSGLYAYSCTYFAMLLLVGFLPRLFNR